jgi:hypothetical protein
MWPQAIPSRLSFLSPRKNFPSQWASAWNQGKNRGKCCRICVFDRFPKCYLNERVKITYDFFPFSVQFSQNDVLVDGSSVIDSGDNTVLGVVVNQPGTDTPVEGNVVEDALHQTIQEDGQTQISNLTLGVVNVPRVSDNQRDNAISLRLTGTRPSEVRFDSHKKLMDII